MIKKILISSLTAVVLVAVGASTYSALASPGNNPIDQAAAPISQGNTMLAEAASEVLPLPSTDNEQVQAGPQAKQGNGNGQSGNGNSQAGSGSGLQGNPGEITTITGTISSYEYSTLTLVTESGQSLAVQLGNTYFAESIGFIPQVGEQAAATVFSDAQGQYSAITITLETSGQTYSFRDESGRPLWSGGNGKGRRGSNNGG